MSSKVKVIIITGYGLNCENETSIGFEICGATTTKIHFKDLVADSGKLREHHILAFVGGFSFGDHLGAGTVLANRTKYRLGAPLTEFINDGKLIIGICNGFQTITRMGLVPALGAGDFESEVALTTNSQGTFRDAWVNLKCDPASPCVFTKGIDKISLPIRHGEGKFVAKNTATIEKLEEKKLVALRYASADTTKIATEFPDNPNGSENAIAGICNSSGRIFGLMPHPEAYLSPYNHPHWGRQKIDGTLPPDGSGKQIFDNAVNFAKDNLV